MFRPADDASAPLRVLHELQVHQIELELRNDELETAYAEAELQRKRCADIYDFTPVAHISVSATGHIVQVNIAGAILLGIKRSEAARHRFAAMLAPDVVTTFNDFLEKVLKGAGRSGCTIELSPHGQSGSRRCHLEGVADESGLECHMIIREISAPPPAG